jgi:hypothetical protein
MAITNKELYENLERLRKELESDDRAIEAKMSDMQKMIDKTYTKLVQFQPVQKIVYGMVAVILIGFLSALLFLIGWNSK